MLNIAIDRVFSLTVLGTYFLYYFVVISSSLTAWLSNFFGKGKLAKWIFFSAIIIPVLVSGLRDGVGIDFKSYARIYDQLFYFYPNMISAITDSRFEPGWVILNYLVRYIFDDVKFIFIISALLTWFFSFKAIYDNRDRISIGIAVLILFCTLYNMSFNIIRQILAVSVVMMAIKPMLDNKKWKFIITVLFASSFHFTALVFLPAYWIVNSKTQGRSRFKKLIVPVLSIGLVFFFQPIFNFVSTNFQSFATYRSYTVGFSGFSITAILLKLPILLLILLNSKKLKLRDNPTHKLGVLFFIGVILMILSSYSPYLNRVSFFYDVTQVFIVSAIIKSQTDKYEKFLYSYAVILYYVARFTYFYLISGDAGTVPYNFY